MNRELFSNYARRKLLCKHLGVARVIKPEEAQEYISIQCFLPFLENILTWTLTRYIGN